MSIFIPPLSISDFDRFNINVNNTAYKSFEKYSLANNLPSLPNKFNQAGIREINEISTIATEHDASADPNDSLRDASNFIGFRMGMRIAGSLKISPLSEPTSLEISLNKKKVWEEDDFENADVIQSATNLEDEIIAQNLQGDFFVLKLFLDSITDISNTEKEELKFLVLTIWNAIQLPLAQVIFNSKSKHLGEKRPFQKFPNKYKLIGVKDAPPHSSYPSGHSAGGGALAALMHYLIVRGGHKATLAGKYISGGYRIGLIREYANLHWTRDNLKGFIVGMKFVKATLSASTPKGNLSDLRLLLDRAVAIISKSKVQ